MTKDQDPVSAREERNDVLKSALRRKLQRTSELEGNLRDQLREMTDERDRLSDQVAELTSQVQIQQALLGKDNELMEMISTLLGPEIQEILEERESATKEGK